MKLSCSGFWSKELKVLERDEVKLLLLEFSLEAASIVELIFWSELLCNKIMSVQKSYTRVSRQSNSANLLNRAKLAEGSGETVKD